ncbi:MGMT family protein [Parvicella tangerina]|uniref:DNA base-flipping protein n=1 Tax=Parvicella tangerina TaxID=2829795 RepID=A0A916JM75_9FLAO|nr:MGMT family protein [Parvicella tangerina]CAG5080171.1 DNA base-flipping protein [Parvicella tangerina]
MKPETYTFFQNVHDVARLIPKGRVTNYGAIAKYLGAPRSSRMVGYAMNAAAGDDTIPAHRVVNRNGLLTGRMHFNTPHHMQELLEKEGIEIKGHQVIQLEKYFWDPMQELLR